MLPEIVDAVGDKTTVLFDSGVRTGTDIIKALCLGARAVLVGRPWVYGLGIAGKAGAKHVLQSMLAVCILFFHGTIGQNLPEYFGQHKPLIATQKHSRSWQFTNLRILGTLDAKDVDLLRILNILL
jgi:hypothetical protein